MKDWGFKISLPGFDVKTATPDQCVIHSEYPLPLIPPTDKAATLDTIYTSSSLAVNGYLSGSLVVTFTSNPNPSIPPSPPRFDILTLPHGLAYTPAALATYRRLDSASIPGNVPPQGTGGVLPLVCSGQDVGSNVFIVACGCDATNFYIRFINETSNGVSFIPPTVIGLSLLIKYFIFAQDAV